METASLHTDHSPRGSRGAIHPLTNQRLECDTGYQRSRAPRLRSQGRPARPMAIKDVSFEELAVRVAADKDQEAFRLLFDHFGPRLKSHLMGLGLPDRQAEDVAQDVMITLWQKAEKYDPKKAKLSTWLFRVARNRFIDLTRKQKYPEVNADDHMGHLVSDDETDAGAVAGQQRVAVAAALTQLKPNQRKVVELSFFEELSHGQIAERLQLPLGTVKSRLRLAFDVLRRELGVFQ